MTKANIIESVLLAVTGGRLSADIDIRREDIEVLIGPAIAMALDDYMTNELKKDGAQLRLTGALGYQPSSVFSVTFELTPQLDSDRELYYIELPGQLILVGDNMASEVVMPKKGRTAYFKIGGQQELFGMEEIGMTFFWHEIVDSKSRFYIDSISEPVCDHLVKASINPDYYGTDDEIPLPAGIELKMIDLLISHFKGQRMFPQDVMINDTDDRTADTVQGSK